MENATRYASFIKRIVTTTPDIRKKLIKSSNLDIIKAICELMLNIYYKRIKISSVGIKKLRKHKQFFVKLLSPKLNLQKRKDLLLLNSDSITALS